MTTYPNVVHFRRRDQVMAKTTGKPRLEYKADIRFRCPTPMADELSKESFAQARDKSDVAREIFAAGLTVYKRSSASRTMKRAARTS